MRFRIDALPDVPNWTTASRAKPYPTFAMLRAESTPTLDLDPLCPHCVTADGLCEFHGRQILPQLAEPSWPRLIGEAYVCEKPECADHLSCNVTRSPAPRAACSCHSCAQRRQATARHVAAPVETHSVAYVEAQERKRAARRPKRSPARRLTHALAGGFSPSLPARSAA